MGDDDRRDDTIVLARCLAALRDALEAGLRRFEELRIDRTSRIVRGATEAGKRRHNPALATAAGAQAYVDQECSEQRTRARYDWLFAYDALAVNVRPRTKQLSTQECPQ